MNSVAQAVSHNISQAIDNDELILPTMPEMALKVREVAESDDAGIGDLNKVISSDTALTARLIKVANSPLFRAPKKIEDLTMALSRLGIQYTCNIAIGLAMEQMFQATSDNIDKRMREVWKKSTEIAGISYVLCKNFTSLRPDQAALAGLVVRIGVLPILSYAEDHPSLMKDSMTLDSVVEELHPSIGAKILTAWDFPEELQAVPSNYLNFTHEANEADYADIATVAMLHAYSGSPKISHIDISEVQAYSRLGLEPDPDNTTIKGLDEEIQAALSMME